MKISKFGLSPENKHPVSPSFLVLNNPVFLRRELSALSPVVRANLKKKHFLGIAKTVLLLLCPRPQKNWCELYKRIALLRTAIFKDSIKI